METDMTKAQRCHELGLHEADDFLDGLQLTVPNSFVTVNMTTCPYKCISLQMDRKASSIKEKLVFSNGTSYAPPVPHFRQRI